MSKRSGPNKENYDETRKIFLDIALEEFYEHGFSTASTSRIVEKSGMARGSLYYHFGDKHGLFEAVYKSLIQKATMNIADKMDAQQTAWDSLITGCDAFLDLCMDKKFRRIFLLEAQSAMPFQVRLSILQQTLMKKLSELLPELLDNGSFPGHTVETAGIFIMGYLAEIGRSFDYGGDVQDLRNLHGNALHETLRKLKGD